MSLFENVIASERGKVTAGLPSVSPERRAVRDYRHRQRVKANAAANEAQAKDDVANAPDGERPRNKQAAAGWWLEPSDLIKRLCRLTPKLHFSYNGPDRIVISELTANPEQPRRYICAIEAKRKIPEFTVFKRPGPQRTVVDIMGWRTVLLRLVTSKVLTQAAVEVAFGPPRMNSRNWQHLFSW